MFLILALIGATLLPTTSKLVDQIIDSIVRQAKGRKVIGLGHSLESLLTLQATLRRPELFLQIIMLDPPLMLGRASFIFHIAKLFHSKLVDKLTPAGLSLYRREHWESREQAAKLLRCKGFYKKLDKECFDGYIKYALREDSIRGGVTLTIPREDEVEIFRSNPSWWWLFTPTLKIRVHLVAGKNSPFLKRGFPQLAKKQMSISFSLVNSGHMFPLDFPQETAENIKSLII